MSEGYPEILLKNNFSMRSLRVFLVENHEDTARYMRLFLEQLSYKVCIAADMATALREIPKSRCDVLISDIGLPDGDGWQLMEKLGDNRPQYAIAMSGYGTGNDQRRSRAAGYKSVDGPDLDFEMRSFASLGQKKFGRSILCVFIPFSNPIFERIRNAHFSEGRELERCRIRNELHKGVSQQLLGAAFGCKLLAGKVATLNKGLGKKALDLAELLNEAVLELQNLVHSNQNQIPRQKC